MNCGEEISMLKISEDWKCMNCGRTKEYFKRKTIIPKKAELKLVKRENAIWICTKCGHSEEINLPEDWKCPICNG